MTAQRRALLIVVAAVILTTPAFMKDLWTPDEPRYALVAREMLESGDYLVLHRNREVYREKPPLFFWSVALVSAPFGTVTEVSARLPSIFSALATVLLTYALARRMFGPREAIWSAVVLSTTFRFWWQSHTGQIDMVLTVCTTLSLYALWRWHESGRGASIFAFHAGTALGLLAKGPPALVVTGLGALGFFWGRKIEGPKLWFWLGAPLSVVPVISWYLLMERAAGGAVTDGVSGTLERQIVGRLFSGVSHAQPPWHYLEALPVEWFPWVLFLPWTVSHVWRTRREGPSVRLLLAWSVPALVFFHIIVEKRSVYLLPLYPPAAILVARSLLALVHEGRNRWMRGTAVVWVAISIVIAALPFIVPHTPYAAASQPRLYLIFAVGALNALWTVVLLRTKAWSHWPAALAVQTAAIYLVASLAVFPVVNKFKTSKPFCEPVRMLARAGALDVYSVRLRREEYIFYSEAPIDAVLLRDPGAKILGDPAMETAAARIQGIRNAMGDACEEVAIASLAAPTESERAALREARNRALLESDLTADERAAYVEELDDEVESALSLLRTAEPAVLFVALEDWRWILSFAEDTNHLELLKSETVSSREMVLLGNRAAAGRLDQMRNGRGN